MMVRARLPFLLVVFLVPGTAFAQRSTTGTVTGKIVDSSGGVLPGVTVSLKSPEALGQFTGVTDAEGLYRVTNLPPATYDVRAELSGFQSVVRKAPDRHRGVYGVGFTMSLDAM